MKIISLELNTPAWCYKKIKTKEKKNKVDSDWGRHGKMSSDICLHTYMQKKKKKTRNAGEQPAKTHVMKPLQF